MAPIWKKAPPEGDRRVVYRTYGLPGHDREDPELLYASTVIEPGHVEDEFFMTRGHFHIKPERGEWMLTLRGEGALVLRDRAGNAWTEALHIVLMGPNDCLVVPFDVPVPMNVEVPGRRHPYTICSAPRISKELDILDEYVAIEQTMGVRKFDAFVSISNADMEKYEKQEGVGRRFWAKWGVAALRGLIERATKNSLPIIVDPQFGEVPVTAS